MSLEGGLHSPVVREYVYTRACFDSGRAQEFLMPCQLALLTWKRLEGFQLVHRWRYQGGGGRKENGAAI